MVRQSPEEKKKFTVILTNIGPYKTNVIRVIKKITGLELSKTIELVESNPIEVRENITKHEANIIKVKLEAVGASVVIV